MPGGAGGVAGQPPGKGTSWTGRSCPPSGLLTVSEQQQGLAGVVSEEEGAHGRFGLGA